MDSSRHLIVSWTISPEHLQQKLSSEAAHSDAVVQAASALIVPSIAGVECNHAFIRRQKLSLEMSHTPSVHLASSLCVLAQSRKGLLTRGSSQARSSRKKRSWKAVPKARSAQRVGWRKRFCLRRGIEKTHGGGAWRIFLQTRLKGKRFSSVKEYQEVLRRLLAEYRRLKQSDPQTFAMLRRQGLRATVAHRNTPRKQGDLQSMRQAGCQSSCNGRALEETPAALGDAEPLTLERRWFATLSPQMFTPSRNVSCAACPPRMRSCWNMPGGTSMCSEAQNQPSCLALPVLVLVELQVCVCMCVHICSASKPMSFQNCRRGFLQSLLSDTCSSLAKWC